MFIPKVVLIYDRVSFFLRLKDIPLDAYTISDSILDYWQVSSHNVPFPSVPNLGEQVGELEWSPPPLALPGKSEPHKPRPAQARTPHCCLTKTVAPPSSLMPLSPPLVYLHCSVPDLILCKKPIISFWCMDSNISPHIQNTFCVRGPFFMCGDHSVIFFFGWAWTKCWTPIISRWFSIPHIYGGKGYKSARLGWAVVCHRDKSLCSPPLWIPSSCS